MKISSIISYGLFVLVLNVTVRGQDIEALNMRLDTSAISVEQTELLLDLADSLFGHDDLKGVQYASMAHKNALLLQAHFSEARSKLMLGKYYLDLGIISAAFSNTRKALDYFEENDYLKYSSKALIQLGDIYFLSGEFNLALHYYNDCIFKNKETKNNSLYLLGLMGKGAVFGNTGKLDSALIIFHNIHDIATRLGETSIAAQSLFNIGDVHLFSGRETEALDVFARVEENCTSDRIGRRHRSGLYNSMALAYMNLGDLDMADKFNKMALSVLRRNFRYADLRTYYELRFRIDTTLSDYKSAITNYLEYSRMMDSIDDRGFRNQLAQFEILYNSERQTKQITELKAENNMKDMQLRQRNIILFGGGVLLVLLTVLIVQIVGSSRKQKRQYMKLQEQKYDLEAASEEIRAQSEDLSEKNKELEDLLQELKRTQQYVIQNEKMASLGVLTAGVAHELNNPLNFIGGGSVIVRDELLQLHKEDQDSELERVYQALDMIDNGIERSGKIIRALTTFSRKKSGTMVDSNLAEVIDNTLLFLNSRLDNGIKLIKDYPDDMQVKIFPESIQQVLLNIIGNALDALESAEIHERIISISVVRNEKTLTILIENNGPQIGTETLQKIFDPFFTTKEPGKGTGLGLSICYSLIDEHKGKISAENTEEGVLFKIVLPCESGK